MRQIWILLMNLVWFLAVSPPVFSKAEVDGNADKVVTLNELFINRENYDGRNILVEGLLLVAEAADPGQYLIMITAYRPGGGNKDGGEAKLLHINPLFSLISSDLLGGEILRIDKEISDLLEKKESECIVVYGHFRAYSRSVFSKNRGFSGFIIPIEFERCS